MVRHRITLSIRHASDLCAWVILLAPAVSLLFHTEIKRPGSFERQTPRKKFLTAFDQQETAVLHTYEGRGGKELILTGRFQF